MEIIKTELGTFARVKKGFVGFRDKDGNFTGKTVDLYAEIPISEMDESGLTKTEAEVAKNAAANIFAKMFAETNPFGDYLDRKNDKK